MNDRIPILSVTRPWSTWIATAVKLVENRAWLTHYRGPMWIHAAKSWDDDAADFAQEVELDEGSHHPENHPTGILALVELTGICTMRDADLACDCGHWAVDGQYHWHLANPRRLATPIPARGMLGLWWPTGDLAEQLAAARFAEVAG